MDASQAPASVALGVPAARLLLADEPEQYPYLLSSMRQLAQLGGSSREPVALTDPAGHRRAIYHPLAVHLCLAAFNLRYESLPTSLWGACEAVLEDLVAPMRLAEEFADVPPPIESVPLTLWQALCLHGFAKAIGRDVDVEIAQSVVHQALAQPGADGSLHPRQDEESLDAWTYRELCGLHALANLALLCRDRQWAQRTQQVARYHLENTQPDNVTTQPWAVFGFIWSAHTRSFADQQLHDVTTQGGIGARPTGLVAGLLLADAAGALAAFET